MRIVHLSSEFAPIAKAGGLGEVIIGLSRKLVRLGNFVEVIIPKYNFIDSNKLNNLEVDLPDFKCLGHSNTMWKAGVEGCALHLLEDHHPAKYFQRDEIYGFDDDIARFTYFSRAALEYLRLKNEPIDVLHLHDWHVSLCAPLVKDLFKDLMVKSVVLSIHNLEYQGKCAVHDLDLIGMNGAEYLRAERLMDENPNFPHSINLLKGGIVYSDAVIPVSPSYAKEILLPEFSFGLQSTLKKAAHKTRGILNGIDTTIWDPSKDKSLVSTYSLETVTKGKQKNRESFDLDLHKRPWVGAVTRLVPQKGPDLIIEAIEKTIELGGTFLLLGSSPIAEIQEQFNQVQKKYQGNPQVLLNYNYDDQLAHLIYGALDLLLVPSRFEPCGLTQLIAMRYGTVPIVRSTGGLKDTVFDCDDPSVAVEKRNGFTFADFTKKSMCSALERAFHLFRTDPTSFHTLIRRGMQSDFSWKKPALEYQKIYAQTSMKSKAPQKTLKERIDRLADTA
ncbi:MAG: glycogen synthase [Chlamydiae bacterium CG10_big_fil_rev_8_21_14_0_10_42_34]|nr:MAG: glycogen synthase [Chlamydiae bacterium CG10_big_fil_rev_8_21_14_0_10_42_34]